MAQVSREVGQEFLHVGPRSIPLGQAIHGECVPQIMQPRLEATTVLTADIRLPADPFKGSLDGGQAQSSPPFATPGTASRPGGSRPVGSAAPRIPPEFVFTVPRTYVRAWFLTAVL